MNPNPTGYPALQQHGNPMLSSPAAYPVQASSPGNQQQLAFYPNPMSSYPQPRTPQGPHHPLQQHQPQSQHSFNPMPVQSSGPGAAMMPASMPQQHPGKSSFLPLRVISSPKPPRCGQDVGLSRSPLLLRRRHLPVTSHSRSSFVRPHGLDGVGPCSSGRSGPTWVVGLVGLVAPRRSDQFPFPCIHLVPRGFRTLPGYGVNTERWN